MRAVLAGMVVASTFLIDPLGATAAAVPDAIVEWNAVAVLEDDGTIRLFDRVGDPIAEIDSGVVDAEALSTSGEFALITNGRTGSLDAAVVDLSDGTVRDLEQFAGIDPIETAWWIDETRAPMLLVSGEGGNAVVDLVSGTVVELAGSSEDTFSSSSAVLDGGRAAVILRLGEAPVLVRFDDEPSATELPVGVLDAADQTILVLGQDGFEALDPTGTSLGRFPFEADQLSDLGPAVLVDDETMAIVRNEGGDASIETARVGEESITTVTVASPSESTQPGDVRWLSDVGGYFVTFVSSGEPPEETTTLGFPVIYRHVVASADGSTLATVGSSDLDPIGGRADLARCVTMGEEETQLIDLATGDVLASTSTPLTVASWDGCVAAGEGAILTPEGVVASDDGTRMIAASADGSAVLAEYDEMGDDELDEEGGEVLDIVDLTGGTAAPIRVDGVLDPATATFVTLP